MAKLNICFTSDIFIAQQRGGISRYFCEVAKQLVSSYDCTVRISSYFHRNAHLGEIGIEGISSGIFLSSRWPGIQRVMRMVHRQFASSRFQRCDLIHSTYFNNDGLRYPSGIPVVTTVYDLINEKIMKDNRLLNQKREECRRADVCIAISESTSRDMVDFLDVPLEKIRVIPLAAPDLPPPFPLTTPSKPFFLWVGPRSGYKNFNKMLEAIDRSPFRDFDIVCTGMQPFTREELLLESKLRHRNIHLKLVYADDQMLSNLYSQALALVYISLYEGFGIPPLEAMKVGCLVVSSNTGSLPEVVAGAALFCDPTSTDSVSAAMEKALGSEVDRGRLIELGKIQAAKFSWGRCAAQTYDIYRNLCSNG